MDVNVANPLGRLGENNVVDSEICSSSVILKKMARNAKMRLLNSSVETDDLKSFISLTRIPKANRLSCERVVFENM